MGTFILICFTAYIIWLYVLRDGYYLFKYRKEVGIPFTSELSTTELMAKLKNELNYPALKDINFNESGEISLTGKYGVYSLEIKNEILTINKINNKSIKRANSQQLEEKECIKAYIQNLFDPQNSSNPQAKYKKLINVKRNRFLILAAFFLFGIIAVLSDGGLDAIKSNGISNSYLSSYSETVTIGEAFDNFFGDSEWTKYKNGAQDLVDFRGSCYYDGEPATLIITFASNEDSFSIIKMTVNGRELPLLAYEGLLNSIYYD